MVESSYMYNYIVDYWYLVQSISNLWLHTGDTSYFLHIIHLFGCTYSVDFSVLLLLSKTALSFHIFISLKLLSTILRTTCIPIMVFLYLIKNHWETLDIGSPIIPHWNAYWKSSYNKCYSYSTIYILVCTKWESIPGLKLVHLGQSCGLVLLALSI